MAIRCDLFGMIKWPFGKVVGDLQLGDQKVTAEPWITWYSWQIDILNSKSWRFGESMIFQISISRWFLSDLENLRPHLLRKERGIIVPRDSGFQVSRSYV